LSDPGVPNGVRRFPATLSHFAEKKECLQRVSVSTLSKADNPLKILDLAQRSPTARAYFHQKGQ
jgi:hypothetical protein